MNVQSVTSHVSPAMWSHSRPSGFTMNLSSHHTLLYALVQYDWSFVSRHNSAPSQAYRPVETALTAGSLVASASAASPGTPFRQSDLSDLIIVKKQLTHSTQHALPAAGLGQFSSGVLRALEVSGIQSGLVDIAMLRDVLVISLAM